MRFDAGRVFFAALHEDDHCMPEYSCWQHDDLSRLMSDQSPRADEYRPTMLI